MTKMNFDKMPLKELVVMRGRLELAIEAAQRRERAELRGKIEALARGHGISVAELFGSRSTKGRKVAAKYQNPDDASETWTGRGRKPRWLVAKAKAGEKMEKFLIG